MCFSTAAHSQSFIPLFMLAHNGLRNRNNIRNGSFNSFSKPLTHFSRSCRCHNDFAMHSVGIAGIYIHLRLPNQTHIDLVCLELKSVSSTANNSHAIRVHLSRDTVSASREKRSPWKMAFGVFGALQSAEQYECAIEKIASSLLHEESRFICKVSVSL